MLALSRNKSMVAMDTGVGDEILPVILEYSQSILFQLAKDFTIRKMSRQASLLFAWSSDDVFGKNFIQQCQDHHIQCPIPDDLMSFAGSKRVVHATTSLLVKSLQELRIQWRIVPVFHETLNNAGYLLVGEAQQPALTIESTDKSGVAIADVLDRMPLYFACKDLQGRYLSANHHYSQLFAESESTLMGKSDFDIAMHADEALAFRADDQLILDKQHLSTEVERQVHGANGDVLNLRLYRVPLLSEQRDVIGVVQMGVDVSQYLQEIDFLRQQRQELQQQQQRTTAFVEHLGLDMRTLLRSVTNNAHSALAQPNTDSTHLRCVLNSLVQRNEMLIRMFDHMLDATRIEAGRILPNQMRIVLHEFIEQILSQYTRQACAKRISVQLADQHDAPLLELMIDSQRVQTILDVLLRELISFLSGGNLKVRTEVVTKADGHGDLLFVHVLASGVGVDGKPLLELMNYLYGHSHQFNHRLQGCGLEFVVLRQMIMAMGGHIHTGVQSDGVCEFALVFPVEVVESISQHTDTGLRCLHVLLVEDNLINQKVERMILEELGCVVDVSSNGEQAIDYFTTRQYDLVLMDIGLPQMDGFEITKRLRDIEKSEHQSETPIVALTAHAFLDDGAGCRDSGMNDVLLKPASSKELAAVLQQWCERGVARC